MSRVFKPKNCPSNGSANLGSKTRVWFAANTAHPEFVVLPNRNGNFAWVRHFISC
jgi:hypothetical protein